MWLNVNAEEQEADGSKTENGKLETRKLKKYKCFVSNFGSFTHGGESWSDNKTELEQSFKFRNHFETVLLSGGFTLMPFMMIKAVAWLPAVYEDDFSVLDLIFKPLMWHWFWPCLKMKYLSGIKTNRIFVLRSDITGTRAGLEKEPEWLLRLLMMTDESRQQPWAADSLPLQISVYLLLLLLFHCLRSLNLFVLCISRLSESQEKKDWTFIWQQENQTSISSFHSFINSFSPVLQFYPPCL